MLVSLALIFLCGIVLSCVVKKLGLPDLVGMLLVGMILGPYTLGILDPALLLIAPDIREIALVIILIRAGLGLNLKAFKKVGKATLGMCFIPALCEVLGVVLIAPLVFGITYLEAAILGTVLAAVSPAVIVPRMLKLIDEGYGVDKSIPQMILAGASVDDVFVIILFTSFLSMAQGTGFSVVKLASVPVAIFTGIGVGIGVGMLLVYSFRKYKMRDTIKVIVILSSAFLMVGLEDSIVHVLPYSGLIGIMILGMVIAHKVAPTGTRLANKFSKLWLAAQLLLFVLVGATVDIRFALSATLPALLVVGVGILCRGLGVMVSLIKTEFTMKEKMFCVLSYMPKATVQAAIGGIPLALGLECGSIVLTVAVIAIITTAPLGALGIDRTYKVYLNKDSKLYSR